MGDPYYRYPLAAADRAGSIPRSAFPGYFSSEAPSLTSHHADMQVASSDINQMQPGKYGVNDISNPGVYPESNLGGLSAGANTRAYPSSFGDPSLGTQRWNASVGIHSNTGVHPEPGYGGVSAGPPIREVPNLVGHRWDTPGVSSSAGVHPEPSLGTASAAATIRGYSSPLEIPSSVGQRRDVPVGISPSSGLHPEPSIGSVPAGASIKGYPSPLKDSTLVDQRNDSPPGTKPGIPDALDENASARNGYGHIDAVGDSNILFVDGLPTNCTRREVGHLFRPFTGYKDIKVVHKEPRRRGDRAMVLCFVEFDDSKCAMTAMAALQGYKFDDKKPDSPALRIQFAHFPFHLQNDQND
ncbi:hypothetical protein ERO13_D08G268700v2 [Gossypium hirsutum]|uniref:Uncharacterized protein isoform X1 n=3 Tax=Gossypium TaxID=3633 RepID=A0A1U8M4P0_GOSHI|nr:uncharacterized protein LOC107932899 isoform X1 [Gossypium hirsutum]KAG4136239.1 hypothetical protein ERO13_D08G268700v2 [Gossypium hirsutum]